MHGLLSLSFASHYITYIMQKHREQYDNCDCNAVRDATCFDCDSSTRFHVCQDEVVFLIKTPSRHLCSALGFEPDTVYYLISMSHVHEFYTMLHIYCFGTMIRRKVIVVKGKVSLVLASLIPQV